MLPDNPKLLAPLEILRNLRRHISHQSPVNLRTDGKKLGHFELAILHTFLPSVILLMNGIETWMMVCSTLQFFLI